VPDPTNPQVLNRYSYVLNNPLKYIDPSGHRVNIHDQDVRLVRATGAMKLCGSSLPAEQRLALTKAASSPEYKAWNQYKTAEAEYAKTMENSTTNIFELGWTTESSGATYVTNYTWDGSGNITSVSYNIDIPDTYKKDVTGAAVVIAHESVHCITKINFGLSHANSLYEEAVAMRFMGSVADELSYYTYPGKSYVLIGLNILKANLVRTGRNYRDRWLDFSLNVCMVEYAVEGVPTWPTNIGEFNFLRYHFGAR
jgi:hypothetical protein